MSDDVETFDFLIPETDATVGVARLEGEAGGESDVALPAFLKRASKVSISREDLERFWNEKVVGLTNTIAESQRKNETEGFHVDEISFSIGVGAKGGVFFVAEGSVEATLSVKLRRG